ncbi:hypothetical protein [Microbacterium luticocti]|uniref:hypothetical protein n=1 Tax=Microbacterium luticocti TaxID=451764 RepID=UPI0012EBB862|nr:hypothetical protein [Microbacterium luticocti]
MSDDPVGRAEGIIAGFDAILPEQERVLEQAAQNVKLGLERDSEIYREFTQLQFFILTVDFDMRVMLRALLADPQNRLTAEKFLALTLEEAEESAGRMVNAVSRAIRTLPNDTGAHLFEVAKFDEAVSAFKHGMSEMRDDKDFNRTLRLIRNTVSGHIVGDEVGVQNGAIWVLTRRGVPRDIDGVLRSQIVYYAIATLKALSEFAHGLQRTVRT